VKETISLRQLLLSSGERRLELNERLVPSPGELGTAREEVVREFLRKHLPQGIGVSTGFVFDHRGVVSKQVDVVVYDRLFSPRFEATGGKEFFPVESVVCVGEVKSALTSQAQLKGAFDNIRSVKELDRSVGGQNISVPGGERMDHTKNHLDQVFAFVFAATNSLSSDAVRDALAEWLDESERHVWPNIVFAMDGLLVTYVCGHGVCPNPMDAVAIAVVDELERKEFLLGWFLRVAMAVQVTRVANFEYASYVGREALAGGVAYFFTSAPDDEQRKLRARLGEKPTGEKGGGS
jgi:hypothetical protein